MNRSRQIDILRALAVLLVLGRHMLPCPESVSPSLHAVTTVWARGGWVGVDLFFVLSGFLVSGLLFREHQKHGDVHIGRFLIRRGFKIYPAFWLLIAATVGYWIVERKGIFIRGLASELLFFQNYGWAAWPHTWSLAVEEHFYLLLALWCFWLAKRNRAKPFTLIPASVGVVSVVVLGLRCWRVCGGTWTIDATLFPSHLRLDSLAFGVLISYLATFHAEAFSITAKRFSYPLLAAGIVALIPPFVWPVETSPLMASLGLTAFYIGAGCILVGMLGLRLRDFAPVRACAYVGSHSYSIYLWHVSAGTWLAESLGLGWPTYAGIYLLGAVGVGIGMAALVEFPAIRMRDHYFPSRSAK